MQSNKTCPLLEQYLPYQITIKRRSINTILKYRLDILQYFRYVENSKNLDYSDLHFIDLCNDSNKSGSLSTKLSYLSQVNY